jgi:hypothetical protein
LPTENHPDHALSTERRKAGILVDVHSAPLPRIVEVSQPQLPRTEPDGQPIESSQLDRDRWNEIVSLFCDWVGTTVHGYGFCDLLALRLVRIVELGDVSSKAMAIVAAARMAARHNRWYVMKIVRGLCESTMDDNLAHRVAVEIRVGALQRDFEACATVIGQDVNLYHPRIRQAISEGEAIE